MIPESTIGPGNLALGQSEDTANTGQMYGIFSREMSAVGYNTILGPCADVNLDPRNPIIGTRSFGEGPRRVAAHVRTAVAALKQHGVLCSAKHFPGHGDTDSDTHRKIPTVDKSLAVLQHNELLPFQATIDSGVDMIMTSHILYPQLDDTYPATLSYKILTELLREEISFRGVVITDSMNMDAMRKFYSPEEATVRALLTGADLVMLSEEHYEHDSASYWDKQKASIQAVKDGRLTGAQLDSKLERIVSLKQNIAVELELYKAKVTSGPLIEMKLAKAAIKVLRNENKVFPLRPGTSVALLNATPQEAYHNLMNARGIGPNQAEAAFDAFAAAFCQHWPEARVRDYGTVLSNYNVVIAVTENHPLPGEDFDKSVQIKRVQQL